jgi:hypothetical protein
MTADRDIYCAAHLLIHLHGADAGNEAARFGALMYARGDHQSLLVWLRITRAIAELQAPTGGVLH